MFFKLLMKAGLKLKSVLQMRSYHIVIDYYWVPFHQKMV